MHTKPSELIYYNLFFSVHIKRDCTYVSWVRKNKIGHLSHLKKSPKEPEVHIGSERRENGSGEGALKWTAHIDMACLEIA